MKASKENPIYSAYIIVGNTKYDVTPAIIGIGTSDQKKQLAQSVTLELVNVQVDDTWLSSIINVRNRLFLYADDGERNDEVFRGYVWTRGYKSSLEARKISLRCYDNLIYFQESEEAAYFSSGKLSKDVMSSLCSKWGVKLDYTYSSITHSKLALRGRLADIFTEDILDLVKDRTGKKYVIQSEKDVMKVKSVGQNSVIYHFIAGQNAISTRSEETMDGMTTQVVILGKADDKSDREPVEATLSNNTGNYGTLQKIIRRSENTSLADAKKEAQGILDEESSPKWEYEVKAPDIPWIRKGDKVMVSAGDMAGVYLIVAGIERDISAKAKEMTLTLEKP